MKRQPASNAVRAATAVWAIHFVLANTVLDYSGESAVSLGLAAIGIIVAGVEMYKNSR